MWYREVWLWIGIIGIIIFIAGMIGYEIIRANNPKNKTPLWVTILLITGGALVVLSAILFAVFTSRNRIYTISLDNFNILQPIVSV
jgi:RsiW-degrading membrane proteinase PrsW (M82 family)